MGLPKGFRHSDESREKMRGRTQSDETRRKISEARKARGDNLTPEGRAQLSASLKGRKLSDETRRKMSESHKRRIEAKAEALRQNAEDARRKLIEDRARDLLERRAARKGPEGA